MTILVMMTLLQLGCSSGISAINTVDQIKTETNKPLIQIVSIPQNAIKKETIKKEIKTVSRVEKSNDLKLNYYEKHYKFWLNYFLKRDRDRFIRHMANADKYRDTVLEILKEYDIPEDIFFVGLIESGYNTHIRSRAQAVGPWQFIKGTAKRYNLRVDSQIDERANIHKATEAAASYFRDLYNIFGNWELALCGYNKGEYGIIRAIKKGNTRDYRELVKKRLIPQETIYYIPKIAAARELYNNRKKYNLPQRAKSDQTYLKGLQVAETKKMSLKSIAKKYKVSYSTLKKLNPDWKSYSVKATSRRPLTVIVPDTKTTKYIAQKEKTIEIPHRKSNTIHVVRRGESLFSIAKKYNISISSLKKENHLRRTRLLIGQRLELPDGVRSKKQTKVYVVRRGDNLSVIARRYRTTVSKLVTLNNLRTKKIFPKQKIYVPI